MHNIAIFASGAGTNARQIIEHFRYQPLVKIRLIICNKEGAGVLQVAQSENIESVLLDKEKFFRGNGYVDELEKRGIDFIVLAGFLWKLPASLIRAYPGRIINIHPALLPKYGGKGMYGKFVHEDALQGGETESGITIHYVDELYDHGSIIFQATCAIDANETAESLAAKVHQLEHFHYPRVIQSLLEQDL